MTDSHSQAAKPAKPVLDAAGAARLTEFARACKAAARAVVLYPGTHPAISATLGRIAHLTSDASLHAPLRLTVMPDAILLDDCALAKPDTAVTELAALLHAHLIGELIVNPGGDIESWRSFLLLLGKAPDAVRADGGIARVWATMPSHHVEIREVDYAEVLRERKGGDRATWDSVIANCLQGSSFELDDEILRELASVAADSERLSEMMAALEKSADDGSGGTDVLGKKTAAMVRLLRTIVDAVAKAEPDRLEPALRNVASAVGRLTPEMLLGLLNTRSEGAEGGELMQSVVSRMSDATIARFVARNVIADSPMDRVAAAFQTLVRDEDERQRLLTMAKDDVAASPLGSTEGFETVWDHVAEKLLTDYSDKPFVSDEYGRELTASRTRALDVEQVHDDPPERIGAWLATVATSALRALDLTIVLDLLTIEKHDDRWGEMMTPVVALLEDLLLVGDFDAAIQIVNVLVKESRGGTTTDRRQHAIIALDLLVAGPMMRHIAAHLATIDEAQFDRVREMCISLGVVLVKPLAETLAVEERPRSRERLTQILVAFGAVARKTIERLKASPNAAVRRTAIYLMREFGGNEALPDLTELLKDSEPQVQREAVRAIINIGTETAYQTLQQALLSGTEQSREAIMQSIGSIRDERAAPMFVFIIRHIDHRGPLATVYVRAIESLGALKDPVGVEALKEALYKGEWWAPARTKSLRAAAAAALARIGTGDAVTVLEEAGESGPRGVRAAVRPHLAELQRRQSKRGLQL